MNERAGVRGRTESLAHIQQISRQWEVGARTVQFHL